MKHLTFTLLLVLTITQIVNSQNQQINYTDPNGLKQGYWEKFYPNGNIRYSGTFKDNNPAGEFKRYNQNGVLTAIMLYKENSDKVYTKFYYPNKLIQAEGYYINKLKDSIWIFYSEDGYKINEVPYKLDKKHGTEQKYYENGNISEKSEWNNGINDGLTMRFYNDGNVMMRIFYRNGILDGEYNVYGTKENILIQGRYVNNKREGKWIYYEENGHVKDELNYVNGIAENQEELEKYEHQQIEMLEKNKGKFQNPGESIYNAIPPQ